MGQSGNPAKKAAKKAPAKKAQAPRTASASDFKKHAAGVDLQLPSSGFWVKAKRVELQTFILQGSVPNELMDVVSEALQKGKKSDIEKMVGLDEGKIDLDTVHDMYQMVNGIVCASMVQPKVHPVPENEDDRDDEIVYVDEIDDMDKMFIFQWNTGGTSDLATFREEFTADMDALAEIQGGVG